MSTRITGFISVKFLTSFSSALTLGIIFMFVSDQGVTAAPVNIPKRAINQNLTVIVSNDTTFTTQTYLNTKLVHQAVTKHIKEHVSKVMLWKDRLGSFTLPNTGRSVVDGAAFTWEY